jgi:GAF domain-containing protein
VYTKFTADAEGHEDVAAFIEECRQQDAAWAQRCHELLGKLIPRRCTTTSAVAVLPSARQGGLVESLPRKSLQTGLLQDRLIGLAGTPDDSSRIDTDLIVVGQLAAWLVAPVEYASVTRRSDRTHVTVAASDDVAVTLDQAQYDDGAGPCLEALEADYPAAVPDIAATMTWPGYRDTAVLHGLKASLSIPLFAGSGTTIAALNLYSRDPGPMATLTSAVWAAYDPVSAGTWNRESLDPGGRELAAGLIGAHCLRSMIQHAIGVLGSADRRSSDHGYPALRKRAAEAGRSLTDTAAQVIEERQQ